MPEWLAIWILVSLALSSIVGLVVACIDGIDDGFNTFLSALQGSMFLLLLVCLIGMAVTALT